MRLLIIIGVVLYHVTNSTQEDCSSTSESILRNRGIFTRVFNQFALSLFQAASKDTNTVISHYESYWKLHTSWKDELIKNNDVQDVFETSHDIHGNCTVANFSAYLNLIFALRYYKLATRIFYQEGIGTQDAWMNLGSFLSPPQAVNFSNSEQASNLINEWYKLESSDTENLIETTDLENGAIAFKSDVNVFNGIWEKRFQIEAPTKRNGKFDNKPSTSVRYMYTFGNFTHGKLPGLDATFCEIPYKTNDKNDAISMFFILPDEYSSIDHLTNNLHEITLDKLLSEQKKEVFVNVPKFEVGTRKIAAFPFNNVEWNMTSSENDNGDFDGTQYVKLFSTVKVVVEDGGASAIGNTNNRHLDRFIANRPFIFLIARTTNNPTILFTGRFSNPDLKLCSDCSNQTVTF